MADSTWAEGSGAGPDAGGPDPFVVVCPGCGAASGDEDQDFWLGDGVLAPQSDFVLWAAGCLGCARAFDLAVWVVNRGGFLRAAGADGSRLEEPRGEGLALLDRYRRQVGASLEGWAACYAADETEPPPLVDAAEPEFAPGRYAVVPMEVLAHARAYRRLACRQPGRLRGWLAVGSLLAVLSLEGRDPGGRAGTLHLSVSHMFDPGGLTPLQLHFMMALFLTPAERPFVRFEPGRWRPLVHCHVPAELSSLEDC
jgi:hypothetical protein